MQLRRADARRDRHAGAARQDEDEILADFVEKYGSQDRAGRAARRGLQPSGLAAAVRAGARPVWWRSSLTARRWSRPARPAAAGVDDDRSTRRSMPAWTMSSETSTETLSGAISAHGFRRPAALAAVHAGGSDRRHDVVFLSRGPIAGGDHPPQSHDLRRGRRRHRRAAHAPTARPAKAAADSTAGARRAHPRGTRAREGAGPALDQGARVRSGDGQGVREGLCAR